MALPGAAGRGPGWSSFSRALQIQKGKKKCKSAPLLRVAHCLRGTRRDWMTLANPRLHKATSPSRVPKGQSSRVARSVPLTAYEVRKYGSPEYLVSLRELLRTACFSWHRGGRMCWHGTVSIPLSLLQYYSNLVSLNGDELDIGDSSTRGRNLRNPPTYSLNWLAM